MRKKKNSTKLPTLLLWRAMPLLCLSSETKEEGHIFVDIAACACTYSAQGRKG